MTIRPLDLAQNIGSQAQLAQERAAEQATERADLRRRQAHLQEQAFQNLERVQKQQEVVGKSIRREAHPDTEPHANPHDASADSHGDPGTSAKHPLHADESPEGKGRSLDIDA